MRHFWKTLALAGVLAAGTWYTCFRVHCDPSAHAAAQAGDVLGWMRCEFSLSEEQFTAIRALHEEHRKECAAHCAAVREARAREGAARQAGDSAGAAAAANAQRDAETLCRASVEAHVRRIAALMTPAEGERYLRLVLPRLDDSDHSGPPDLSPAR